MDLTNSIESGDDGARDRILRAARHEFSRRGFGASSVRTIAGSARVTAAMINYYFGGKRSLYDAVIEEAQARLHRHLGAAVSRPGGASAAGLAGAYFDFLAEEPELQRILLREVLDGGVERFPEMLRPLRRLLGARVQGERATQAALSLFGAIAGYFIYEPVLGEVLGGDPTAPAALARRRAHIVALASRIEELAT